MPTPALYDTIGVGYAQQRRPDPRIAAVLAVLALHHWADRLVVAHLAEPR